MADLQQRRANRYYIEPVSVDDAMITIAYLEDVLIGVMTMAAGCNCGACNQLNALRQRALDKHALLTEHFDPA